MVELASFSALAYLRAFLLMLGLVSIFGYLGGDFSSAGLGGEIGFCKLISVWVRWVSN